MPKEKIALFTYTWVNKDSVAGAAFGVWGPGVGGEAITGYLPDRPVPRDMNFDAWQIEGFSMRQDLAFETAEVRWEGPEASVDFRFEGFHPPYAYSTHAGGCPPFAADARNEPSGRIPGTVSICHRELDIRPLGHRMTSRGTRSEETP